MFVILIKSALWALNSNPSPNEGQNGKDEKTMQARGSQQVLRNLAISQLFLVLLTLSTAHVQIITRISSAFPIWLWYGSTLSQEGQARIVDGFVKFMVLYALIQGGFYASFLPPA